MAKYQKVDVESIKARLGAVTDLQGNELDASDDFVEFVTFEARGARYQVAVQTNLYSTSDVLSFQNAQAKAENLVKASEAKELITRMAEDFPLSFETENREVKRLIKNVHKLAELVPVSEASTDPLDAFKRQAGFVLIGALAWNVPDIELTPAGLLGGDFRVVTEASSAIMGVLNPTSTEAETDGTSDEPSLLTGSPSTETAGA